MIENWKQAAQQTMPDGDIEKNFLDQAYMSIQNKATPIMKPPYRLGFEIVHKNDANTRMVGIFVFRLGKDLYYAPVFFINGAIKGTDLFYRHATKTFIPLTNEWVDYLLNLSPTEEGYSVEPKMRLEATPSNMDFNRIINPPTAGGQTRKFASSPETQAAWTDMQKTAAELSTESLLKRFIVEDGKEDAIQKIANTVKADKAFAKALFYGSSEANYMPDIPAEKSAAAPDVESLVVHFNLLNNPGVKQASAADLKRGYSIEDNRKEASINPIVEASETSLNTISEPGVYEVLMADGAQRECVVATQDGCMLERTHPHDAGNELLDYSRYNPKDKLPRMLVIDLEDGCSAENKREQPIFGKFLLPIDKCEKLKDSMETGKAYRVYCCKDGSFSRPILIVKKEKSPAGLDCYYYSSWSNDEKNAEFVLHNPDYEGAYDSDRVLGKHFKFISVSHELEGKDGESYRCLKFPGELMLGNRSALDSIIYGDGYKKAAIQRAGANHFMVKMDDERGRWSPHMTKIATRLYLMAECGMRVESADEVLDRAEKGCHKFFHKSALHLRAQSYPEFYAQFNDAYNVMEEPENLNSHDLIAHRDIPLIERNRVGDSVRHEAHNQDNVANPKSNIPSDMLQTASPIQLYELSQSRGVGNLFEHGVVGSLTKTYDSIALVDKYIPDLEQGLDRIGRILFLYYWKPEDFAQAYGSDDQVDLENKLLSNFKQLGDMVLELLLKSQRRQSGSSTMKS